MWRLATAADDEIFVTMCDDLSREDPAPGPVPPAHMRRTLDALRAEPLRGHILALEQDGAIAGYALLISFWSNEFGGEICNIDEIYIRPENRGRGAARDLIRGVQDGSGLWPRRPVAIELEVRPDNARAIAFYKSLGFVSGENAHLRLDIS